MTPPAPRERLPWWTGIAPAEMSLDCSGNEHRLRWARGRLVTPDHPDADRERALIALGGEPVACLDLLDAWTAHTDDLDLLVLASRGPADPLPDPEPSDGVRYSGGHSRTSGVAAYNAAYNAKRRRSVVQSRRRGGAGWTSYRPLNSGSHRDSSDTAAAVLVNLDTGLTDRLVATVIATWTHHIDDRDHRVPAATPALRAALYGRALATIRSLDLPYPLDLVMVEADAPRSVTEENGRIRCRLPFSWLGDVWAKGLATVLGHLCLEVETADDNNWRLLVADRDLHSNRTMTIHLAHPLIPPDRTR